MVKTLFVLDNKLLLTPEIFKCAIGLLGRLSRKEDLQRDLKILNDLLRIVEHIIASGFTLYKPTEEGYVRLSAEESD